MKLALLISGVAATCWYHCLKEAEDCANKGSCLYLEHKLDCENKTSNNAEYWIAEPWDFGGKNRGFISGDGLIYKGCIEPSSQSSDMNVDVDTNNNSDVMIAIAVVIVIAPVVGIVLTAVAILFIVTAALT